MSNKNFQLYSRYYDLLNNDKNYEKEIQYLCSLFTEYKIIGRNILELGSGTGIHGKLLAKNGYKVLGVELSNDMVKKARRDDYFSCVQGDIRKIKLKERFEIVISLFHVISYQTSNNDLLQVFNTASEHLNNGGFFIFDTWYSPAVYSQKPGIRVRYRETDSLKVIRVSEPSIYSEKNQVDVKFKIYINDLSTNEFNCFEEIHSMRHFSIPEIAFIAGQAGFKLLKAEEFLTGQPPSGDTWGVCFIMQKNND